LKFKVTDPLGHFSNIVKNLFQTRAKEAEQKSKELEETLKKDKQEASAKMNKLGNELNEVKAALAKALGERDEALRALETKPQGGTVLFSYADHVASMEKLWVFLSGAGKFAASTATTYTPDAVEDFFQGVWSKASATAEPVWVSLKPYADSASQFLKKQKDVASRVLSDVQKSETYKKVKRTTWSSWVWVVDQSETFNDKVSQFVLEPLFEAQPAVGKVVPVTLVDRLFFAAYVTIALVILAKLSLILLSVSSWILRTVFCCRRCRAGKTASTSGKTKRLNKKFIVAAATQVSNGSAAKTPPSPTPVPPPQSLSGTQTLSATQIGKKLEATGKLKGK